jgi:hypothetical protein|tara:strand:+ start:385 stop:1782 length:1398 start_codon:yes stop_codon:yes gene_type:complete
MADKTVADLPKKNAAPAEPAKSLQATVQQVMNKAITSPTDAKVDFAQGVNHITGDAHQKSAGAADAMQSLKAEAEPNKTKAVVANEADEKKDEKEKEEVKEAEYADKKDDEKKDVKEGEMPAGLKNYLDKKSDKSDDKEDKKDVKESDEKEKDVKGAESLKASADKVKDKEHPIVKEEDEKKKEDAKESSEKEDEKKKEVSESEDKKEDEKEVKKETAKDKVKDMDMKEDVAALTDGEELSEEFKAKAATIFEASVKAKLVEEIEKLEGEYETKVAEKVEETKSEIVEKVDAYLNYVVEEWMKENELAIEKGLRAEITEDFIGGLKSLFESHYINVPQEKYDVIEAQTAEIEKLKEEVNQTIEKNVELNQAIGNHVRQDIINDVSSDLAETETEKLKGLAESIEYKDAESFRTSVETLKNSYFPKAKASETESNEVAENNAGSMNESMAAYTAAISKSKKNPYLK